MRQISCKRHRFPPEVIRQAVWLYYRFTLSFRDMEELLAARGIDVSYETVRCWAEKFGLVIVANIRQSRPRPGSVWYLDEMVIRINGKRMWLWHAMNRSGRLRENNRAENSHLAVRRRERKMQRFKSQGQAQRFVSIHGAISNLFNVQRHLLSRSTLRTFRAIAMEGWDAASAAAA